MPAVRLAHPAALLALAALPALAALWWRALRKGAGGPGDVARGLVRLAALALLVVALAGPVAGPSAGDRVAGARVVFVLDVSASSLAPDVAPPAATRLEAARRTARELAALVPEAAGGLVLVAGEAAVVCPPTLDRAAFLELLQKARPAWMGTGGSALARGLEAAATALDGPDGGVVVLLSDGEDHGPPLLPAVEALRARRCVLHAVTVGTPAGARLSPPPAGAPPGGVHTRARPGAMAAWARAGGGAAWRPDGLPRDPRALVPRHVALAAMVGVGRARDLRPWFCGLAAALLLADPLLRLRGGSAGRQPSR